ncbi:MAG: DNA replication protein DnaC, partial [Oscillospiraceae bacterium]|nr:DNA replication protein DnaC [Oscillospiraceae bacterium]
MAVDGKVLRIATDRFEQDKAARAAKAQRRRQQIYRDVPRVREIDTELRTTMSQIVSGALQRGTDPLPAIRVIRDNNLALQQERQALLQRYGYSPDALDDAPACPLCGDSGYVRGGMCRCLKKYYHDAQIAQLSQLLDLGHQSFETFEEKWYSPIPDPELGISPREQANRNFDACRDFANEFSRRSGS